MGSAAAGVLGIALVGAPAGAEPKPKSTTTTTAKPKKPAKPKKKTCCTIGDTGTSSGFKVTVYGVTDPQPPPNPDFGAAPAGTHYVSVDVQIANPSKDNVSFSSLIGFHLLDSKNRQYDETLVIGLTPPTPEGQIPPQGAVRGLVGFQVPDGTTGLKLRVQGSITASGVMFRLS
jgi:Domain of unknown function (DUF4352)